eukprot:SAG31_NODE_3837_length_3834_cov_1.902276_5_plen_344_part_00
MVEMAELPRDTQTGPVLEAKAAASRRAVPSASKNGRSSLLARRPSGDSVGGSSSTSSSSGRRKRWQPPIKQRRPRVRDNGPGPAAYVLDKPWDQRHRGGAGRWSTASKDVPPRQFYQGAGPNLASSMFGADSPGPVYGTGGGCGKWAPGPRAAGGMVPPGFSPGGQVQRPSLQPSISPGPKYLYEDTTLEATRRSTMAGRSAIPKPQALSPGPTYNLRTAQGSMGNVNQNRAAGYSIRQTLPSPEKVMEPGPGAFDVTDREIDATRPRAKRLTIAERFDDRRGKIRVPRQKYPGPETAQPDYLSCTVGAKGGTFGRSPAHGDSILDFHDTSLLMEQASRMIVP